ncbi:MerR family transcriptional regulator [Roseimarinus sediminis]|uniref:MerR family transcriptional regulator n=1 Tax=Roseimarinus sediminis TaxID=1610899 RepID=UPI003D231B98
MKLYSIGELAVLSQIKAHTIRIWEQRYQLLTPERSEGNTRYYSESQLKKLLKVALLNKSGMKISHIARLSDDELLAKTAEVAVKDHSLEVAVDNLMVASMNFDQHRIIELFDQYNEKYGIEDTFEKIIFPYLRVVGNLWVNGKITPGHEHFFTNLCKLRLFSAIDHLPLQNQKLPHILLAQPEWDFHELGILYYQYLFRKAGYPCTYLGQAVPAADVIQTASTIKAEVVITTFIGPTTQEQIMRYLSQLLEQIPDARFYISGPHVDFPLNDYEGRLTVFYNMQVLIDTFQLKTLKQ